MSCNMVLNENRQCLLQENDLFPATVHMHSSKSMASMENMKPLLNHAMYVCISIQGHIQAVKYSNLTNQCNVHV